MYLVKSLALQTNLTVQISHNQLCSFFWFEFQIKDYFNMAKKNLIKITSLTGTYKVRNEIETKRNETKSTKPKRNETKRNEINEMKTK